MGSFSFGPSPGHSCTFAGDLQSTFAFEEEVGSGIKQKQTLKAGRGLAWNKTPGSQQGNGYGSPFRSLIVAPTPYSPIHYHEPERRLAI